MRISYSRYKAFTDNPERFRLHYVLGLTPEGDDTPTRMNLGRRRGSCFHALYEAMGDPNFYDLHAGLVKQYGSELVARCEAMMEVVPDLGEMSLVEHEFETPIGDGKHSINGRIDHGFVVDGAFRIGDFKTTKGNRTKKELGEYLATLETSPQSHFYLKAAAALGRPTELFTYHIVLDRKTPKHKPTYLAVDLHIGPREVERTMQSVYAACEAIEFLTNVYGAERPWPHANNWPCSGDKFFCGFQGLCGRTLPKGVEPPGFTNKYRDLIELEGM